MQKRLFIDMDGTLARFHDEVQYLERMFEKDFFLELKPFEKMVEALRLFVADNPGIPVFILSACVVGAPPYCRKEKQEWCDKHLPFIKPENTLFVPMNKNKADFIPGGITHNDYLYDDYNKNLEQWQQSGGQAIKCKNNINHLGKYGKLWEGKLIDNQCSPFFISAMLKEYVMFTRTDTMSASEYLDKLLAKGVNIEPPEKFGLGCPSVECFEEDDEMEME